MDVEVVAITPGSSPSVERLLQLYEYDASEFYGADVEADGLYHVLDPATLWRANYHVYLIAVDAHLAGFAFVSRHNSYVSAGETWLIDEFFIVRKYRRRGIGGQVARSLFDRFPGRWEIGQLAANLPAQAF